MINWKNMDKLTIEKTKQKNPLNNPDNNNINILPSDNTSEEDVIISPIKLMNTLSSTKPGIIPQNYTTFI